ncbi:alpha/beta hydrolase [Acetobacteraceae bacterium H6797]|nr:alpha/beta hydrolase [Acetobacteraceae bacterium H6797]
MSFVQTLATALAKPGKQAIPFIDEAGDPTRPLVIHTYRATGYAPGKPAVFVQHGMNRNGDEYRDFWVEAAEKHGLLIIAPNYGNDEYPGAEVYNNGHVIGADGSLRPREKWGYAVPGRLFAMLREAGVTTREKAFFFGHSAGGQFGHRMAATQPLDIFEAIAIGNPGWYTLPTLERNFPEGMGGIGLGEKELLALLAYPLLIMAGEKDIETSGPSLPAQPQAVAQGPHRFARAHNYLAAGRAEAARRGVACNWRLQTVPHIGHDGAAMSRATASLWFEGVMPSDAVLAEWGGVKSGAL